jgi:predicted metal-dependent phosphoesterase TrpH
VASQAPGAAGRAPGPGSQELAPTPGSQALATTRGSQALALTRDTLAPAQSSPEPRSFADLHSHSRASFDSLADPRRMIERARSLGLTHLAITDHERIDGARRAADLAPDDLQVIVGEEIRTRDGDLIGLFLEEVVASGYSAAETAAAIREQGGLVGLPHPFDGLRASGGSRAGTGEEALAALASAVDFVEAHNARAYRGANPAAAAFAARHELPGVASSDAHSVMEVGIACTVLPGRFSTAEELRAMLPQAEMLTGRASYTVRLWTPFAKVVQLLRGNRRIRPGDPARVGA